MKKYTSIILFVLIGALSLNSCNDDYGEPEPYTPYMGKEAPDFKTKIYINNQITPVNQYDFKVTYQEKENYLNFEGDSIFKFPIKITNPADEKLVVKCAIDDAFIEDYNEKNDTEFEMIPSHYYIFEKNEVTIKSGQTESKDSISVRLKFDNRIKELQNDILLPIQIVSVNETKENISSNLSRINAFGTIIIILDNIDSSGDVILGEEFNNNIILESNQPWGLNKITDGNVTGGYWYPGNSSTYLTINLPEQMTIKGLKINSRQGNYLFRSVTISVKGAGGRYTVNGVFDKKQSNAEFYIKFKTPVTTRSIKLQDFRTQRNGAQTDISEINLIK